MLPLFNANETFKTFLIDVKYFTKNDFNRCYIYVNQFINQIIIFKLLIMKRTILLLMATFAIIIAGNYVATAQNMLTNPGFEDWVDNGAPGPPDAWPVSSTTDFTASQDAVNVHGGSYSVNLTWTTQTNRDLQQIDLGPLTAGDNFEFSVYALDNDPAGYISIYIRWEDAAGGYLSNSPFISSIDDPNFQFITTGSQIAPPLSAQGEVRIRCYDVSSNWDGDATVYVDDANLQNVSGAPPVITNAYAISSTAMDLVYDKDITSVSNGDYALTGSASITFSSATIDGTDAKIVHLTGASTSMAGDITLDNIEDFDNGTNYNFYAGILPISYTNTVNPGGTILNGYTATFQGIVSANDDYRDVWVSDNSGQYNGVLIFDYDFDAVAFVGDEILFACERDVFNNLTEMRNPILINTLSTGNTPYGPDIIPGSDIDETIPAETNPAEAWESQLVKIEDFTIVSYDNINYDYVCSWTDGISTYTFHMGDLADTEFANITLTVGETYPSITGVVDWDFYNFYYRINPRNQEDIEGSVAPATQLAIVSVNGGTDPETSSNFSVVVQVWGSSGNPTIADGDINFTFTTNGGDLLNVDFVTGTTTTGTILDGTSEITVTGVQMDPAGTNVTITANDDAAILTSGTSAPFDVIQGISYIAYQGFEQSGDTWNYSTNPPPYYVPGSSDDVWDVVSSLSAITPAAGDFFWGMQDLDNEIGGGNFWHTLDLDPVDISSYGGVDLSFQYYTIGFDSLATDTLGYVIEYDNGTTWGDPVFLISNTLGWATVTIPIPNETNYVRLRLQARQNGGSDYAGWDDIKLLATTANPPTKLSIISVNGGDDPYENSDFEVIVQTQDAGGVPSAVATPVNFTLTTNGGDLGTVGFVGGTTTTGTIETGSNFTILTGVQMNPTGTNVTITANDDATFNGLSPGTSELFDVVEFVLPAIMITEVMKDPFTVSDSNGEWFEVYNNSSTPVDMIGWVMKDLGSNEHTILSSVVVPAFGFAVLGNDANSATNGGYTCDYEFTSFFLGNSDDEIILYLPDGITEVDRVEWDAGTLWPDPIGASMVFAGFNTEDNNDGTNWVTAYRRESSYVDAGDNGSPGTNGYQQLLTGGFKLSMNAFLEGPYDADVDMMAGNLFIPQGQPFDTVPYYGNLTPKWLYAGADRYSNFNGIETDWVLIELRDATTAANAGSAATIDTRPAMLLDDGSIVALNGFADLSLNLSVTNNLYIVIWHRNHLGIMSATGLNPVAGDLDSYDFTTGSDKVYGTTAGYIELEPGVWGMVAGDVNADGTVDTSDNADGWSTDTGKSGYLGGDLNLNGQSNNQDKNDFWLPNNVTNSQVPN